jgi:hypothetical protein
MILLGCPQGPGEHGILHVQVTHAHYRKPGDLSCPKCGHKACLEGKGLRQGTRSVLYMHGHRRFFSFGLKHKKCPVHGGGEAV